MIKIALTFLLILPASQSFFSFRAIDDRSQIASEIENSIQTELLNKWYPQCVDKEYGGFLTTYSYDFKLTGVQDKMLVTQARHTWSNARASELYPSVSYYKEGAERGLKFLKEVMWDKDLGGFYTLVTKEGKVKDSSKSVFANAYSLFALAQYYKASKDIVGMDLAKKKLFYGWKNIVMTR